MTSPRALKAVVFDLDGTLLNCPYDFAAMRHAVMEVASAHGLSKEALSGMGILEAIDRGERLLSGEARRKFRREADAAVLRLERAGAKSSTPLAGAKDVLDLAEQKVDFRGHHHPEFVNDRPPAPPAGRISLRCPSRQGGCLPGQASSRPSSGNAGDSQSRTRRSPDGRRSYLGHRLRQSCRARQRRPHERRKHERSPSPSRRRCRFKSDRPAAGMVDGAPSDLTVGSDVTPGPRLS